MVYLKISEIGQAKKIGIVECLGTKTTSKESAKHFHNCATNTAPNNPLAHELESCAVIEGSKPDKWVLIESVLANLSNRVKRGR